MLNARGEAADLRFTVETKSAASVYKQHAVSFAGFTAAAAAVAAREEDAVVRETSAEIAAKVGVSTWTPLLSSSGAIDHESKLETDAAGQVQLTLPAYGYVVLKQVQA
ncbi:hypothetical protein D3C78_1639530 [compost metagenome]